MSKVKMTVKMEVTAAQALTLQAMFDQWNHLAAIGASRDVSFFVDGDGNFHPKCEVTIDGDVPELTDELREKAFIKVPSGYRFDFDAIAWKIND